jgi:hydroxymethylbilane synthase
MIRIGTRGSPLALVQARAVADMLAAARPGCRCEIVTITTQGDRMTKTALWEIGGKGLFVQEIETALIEGRIDLAVHSMKDMPQEIPDELTIGAVPRREDVRDVLVARTPVGSIGEIPAGLVIGTSSLRRRAQILRLRPDLTVSSLRGNIGTRLRKLSDNQYGGVILAAAGIGRLGIEAEHRLFLSPEDFVPAAGQGALALEVRRGEEGLVSRLDDADTRRAVFCEREFVAELGASCRSAVGAWARVEGGRLVLNGRVLSPDGTAMVEGKRKGDIGEWEGIGRGLGADLLDRGAAALLSEGCTDDEKQ